MNTLSLGFSRIGERRELKSAVEAYWRNESSLSDLEKTAATLRKTHWLAQKDAGIDLIPSNDFSLYDHVLDTSLLLGNIPARFVGAATGPDLLFDIARGRSAHAGEMTKWFDTNYHYIVPEFTADTTFAVSADKPFAEFSEALALGIRTKPVLLGPLTYLHLGKGIDDPLTLLDRLVPAYAEILARLSALGAEWVQLDEPILSLDLAPQWQLAFHRAYEKLRAAAPSLKILLATYFGPLGENLPVATRLPIDALHLDLTRGTLDGVLEQIPSTLQLSLGIVDGRNIWRNDFEKSLAIIAQAQRVLSNERLWLAPSCSLLHSPVTLRHETKLDPELKGWLAFGEEKLREVATLARLAAGKGDPIVAYRTRVAILSRRASPRIHNPEVKSRPIPDARRISPFASRRIAQQSRLNLPLLPTTTIGSFPQTPDLRAARAKWKRGELSPSGYDTLLAEKTRDCIRAQETSGLDVLVHGEFERNDMVEYFGEQLAGFAFTANGWVQSYGSRCVKPPIIFGDVHRPHPMTVEWATRAQSFTSKPVKGMLTGPITILQWSFVRDDQPRSKTARQVALAIRDEVRDLEAAGIAIIQIDEPALREGLPLRLADQPAYLDWATEAFRIASTGVRDDTQIHTHMCYCDFDAFIGPIASLDADVISLEASRSEMTLLDTFANYPNALGPGIWDIHSPTIPTVEEITALLEKAAALLPVENLWVNPDCGLKTRAWPETIASLANLVAAAKNLRASLTRASAAA